MKSQNISLYDLKLTMIFHYLAIYNFGVNKLNFSAHALLKAHKQDICTNKTQISEI